MLAVSNVKPSTHPLALFLPNMSGKIETAGRGQAIAVETAHDPKAIDNEVFQLTHDIETARPSATTPAMFKLYFVLSVGYFCIILQGYDGSLMGAINAMPQYLKYYGL